MIAALALATMFAAAAPAPKAINNPAPTGDTIVVKMVAKGSEYVYAPSKITAHPGDVIQFVDEGNVPHDVMFTKTPKGAKLGSAKMSPFLTTKGQTYDIALDGRFPVGHYAFQCLPHAAMGMKGTIDVVAGGSGTATGPQQK